MIQRASRGERGDTLIEVLVAVVALSLVVTICYGVMTRGYAQGQTALERTTTQGMIGGQTAILRDIFTQHEQARAAGQPNPAEWTTITGYLPGDIDPAQAETKLAPARTACQLGTTKQFYFDPSDDSQPTTPISFIPARMVRTATYPVYGDGVWIEGYKVYTTASDARPYYIFFIKACWDAAISGERQSMVTNVRFYESYD